MNERDQDQLLSGVGPEVSRSTSPKFFASPTVQDQHSGKSWILPLSYLRPPLSLNDRRNRYAAAAIRREVMDETLLRARVAKLPVGLDHAYVELHWEPSTRRARDTDNMTLTIKACIDALTRGSRSFKGYGLTPDDTHEQITQSCHIHPAQKPGRIWLVVRVASPQREALERIATAADVPVEVLDLPGSTHWTEIGGRS